MKKLWILLAVMLPLAGCPKKAKQDNVKQPDNTNTTTPTPDPDSEPASNRATPATPAR